MLSTVLSDKYKKIKLRQDCSTRWYERVYHDNGSYIIMHDDDQVNIAKFIKVAEYINSLGLSAPIAYEVDLDNGLVLLEDFGDESFNSILYKSNKDRKFLLTKERELYELAIQVLLKIQPQTNNNQFSVHTTSILLQELEVFINWYVKAFKKVEINKDEEDAFYSIMNKILGHINEETKVITLRDYHVDNLMFLPRKEGLKQVGILDFQDAVFSSPSYDLVSIIEDARRSLEPEIAKDIKEYFIKNSIFNAELLYLEYDILSLQRNLRILGVFARISYKNGRKEYERFIPRTEGYVKQTLLINTLFKEMHRWFNYVLPGFING